MREIDLRPNDAFRFVNSGPDGMKHPFAGIYREIEPPGRMPAVVFNQSHGGGYKTHEFIEGRSYLQPLRCSEPRSSMATLAQDLTFLEAARGELQEGRFWGRSVRRSRS